MMWDTGSFQRKYGSDCLDALPSADCSQGHEPTLPAAPLQTTNVCNVSFANPLHAEPRYDTSCHSM